MKMGCVRVRVCVCARETHTWTQGGPQAVVLKLLSDEMQ